MDDIIIAEQAREISALRKKLRQYEEDRSAIRFVLFCIGGPLNDNKLGYTGEQKRELQGIANRVRYQDEEMIQEE